MKEIQKITVGMAGILLLGAINQSGAAVITDFTAPPLGHWTEFENEVPAVSPPATYSATPTTLIFTAPDQTTGIFPSTYISVISSDQFSGAYTLNVNMTVARNGDEGSVQGYWLVASSQNPKGHGIVMGEVNTAGIASENFSINIPSGDYLSFEITGSGLESAGKNPADLDVTINEVPEAGTWLAGVFLVGVLVVATFRQNRVEITKGLV